MDKKEIYFNYLMGNSKYFKKYNPNNNEDGKVYRVTTELPNHCFNTIQENSPWKFYGFKNQNYKEQGWKIHVSATLNNAQEILEIISKKLIEDEIPFKHIIDEPSLHNLNSKIGNRVSSGKFIAIYPPTDEKFLELLDTLYYLVKDFEGGPYILNDKCWKDSNIYYRYGGFKSMYNEKGELCIKDELGKLIPDYRQPYYQVPNFVKKFDEFLDSKNNIIDESEENHKLKEYEFQKVLRFTNGGGIYLGERKSDNKKVVIKEARPKVGLDGLKIDAIERQEVEYKALTTLADVEGIVDVIDYFKCWKHNFLVEEFVEGLSLHAWIATNYPFHHQSDNKQYLTKVRNIILTLVNIVETMHSKNVGMGDIQPANIIITPDLNVKLIDFESAYDKDEQRRSAMHTLGFYDNKNKTHKERDWYAVKRILRFCVLPIGPITAIEQNISSYQNEWVKREYGEDFYIFFKEIEDKCDEHLAETKEIKINEYNDKTIEINEYNDKRMKLNEKINSIIQGLGEGILKNLVPEDRLIHGDIRQFEMPGGKTNVLTGGTGAALSLYRSGIIDQNIIDWIEEYLIKNMHSEDQLGLFTGKTGIATTLYELGYKNDAMKLFNSVVDNYNLDDISLRSGLAGIGLSLVSLYLEDNNSLYLDEAKKVVTHINDFVNQEKNLSVNDWSAIPIGLIDGWSGVSLFYSVMYSITNDRHFYFMAKDFIERDLKNTKEDNDIQILQTIDEKERLLPYLSGGSIGIGVAIWYLNHVSGEKHYQKELEYIVNLNGTKCTFSGGLLDGAGGFLILSLIEEGEIDVKNIQSSIDRLDLFLIYKENHILFPGNFCYRLSDDLYSGSSGIILALKGILESNPLYWLPIININSFLSKTKKKIPIINN